DDQGPAQAVDPFAISNFADSGIASWEHHQLGSPKVEARHFKRSQQAILLALSLVGPGQGEAGTQQGIFQVTLVCESFLAIWEHPLFLYLALLIQQKKAVRRDMQDAGAMDQLYLVLACLRSREDRDA